MSTTYRVYILDTRAALAPVALVAYVKSDDKYKGAWQNAVAALDADKRGKGGAKLYSDAACTQIIAHAGDDFKCAKIVDMTTRNVKLDKSALAAILAGDGDAATKLAALAAAIGK